MNQILTQLKSSPITSSKEFIEKYQIIQVIETINKIPEDNINDLKENDVYKSNFLNILFYILYIDLSSRNKDSTSTPKISIDSRVFEVVNNIS